MDSHLVDASDDTQLTKLMKMVMLQDLQGRYTGETLQLLTKASISDPSFKGLKFRSQDDRKMAHRFSM